jgi:hypothetical protein
MQDLVTQPSVRAAGVQLRIGGAGRRLAAARAVHRKHPLSHFFCALLAGAVTALVVLVHARLHGLSTTGVTSFAGALYTALLAPFIVGALQRMKGLFAFGR